MDDEGGGSLPGACLLIYLAVGVSPIWYSISTLINDLGDLSEQNKMNAVVLHSLLIVVGSLHLLTPCRVVCVADFSNFHNMKVASGTALCSEVFQLALGAGCLAGVLLHARNMFYFTNFLVCSAAVVVVKLLMTITYSYLVYHFAKEEEQDMEQSLLESNRRNQTIRILNALRIRQRRLNG